MSEEQVLKERVRIQARKELIYCLEDRPSLGETFIAGIQHLMAIIISIGVPPVIILLGFTSFVQDGATIAYLVNMSLLVSGVATFIQCKAIGPIGSGLLSIQGTSFAFVSTLGFLGQELVKKGYTTNEVLGVLFTCCLIGSLVQMVVSRFLPLVQRFISPLISGIIVTLIGGSLLYVALQDIGGGAVLRGTENFGAPSALIVGFTVTLLIVIFNRSTNRYLRIGATVLGILGGLFLAIGMDIIGGTNIVNIPRFQENIAAAAPLAVPLPFKFGLGFDLSVFIPVLFLYLMTVIESYGDLTATSMVSGEPFEGEVYERRVANGILGDGFNSALASIFSSFPNTTFSQNNGVVAITGVASRRVGYMVAALLVVLGLFPAVGAAFTSIPSPVIGGATLIMFGSVMVSGIRIISSNLIDRRGIIIMAISLALGFGIKTVPDLWQQIPYETLKTILSNSITLGGFTALLLNFILPKSPSEWPIVEIQEPIE